MPLRLDSRGILLGARVENGAMLRRVDLASPRILAADTGNRQGIARRPTTACGELRRAAHLDPRHTERCESASLLGGYRIGDDHFDRANGCTAGTSSEENDVGAARVADPVFDQYFIPTGEPLRDERFIARFARCARAPPNRGTPRFGAGLRAQRLRKRELAVEVKRRLRMRGGADVASAMGGVVAANVAELERDAAAALRTGRGGAAARRKLGERRHVVRRAVHEHPSQNWSVVVHG